MKFLSIVSFALASSHSFTAAARAGVERSAALEDPDSSGPPSLVFSFKPKKGQGPAVSVGNMSHQYLNEWVELKYSAKFSFSRCFTRRRPTLLNTLMGPSQCMALKWTEKRSTSTSRGMPFYFHTWTRVHAAPTHLPGCVRYKTVDIMKKWALDPTHLGFIDRFFPLVDLFSTEASSSMSIGELVSVFVWEESRAALLSLEWI